MTDWESVERRLERIERRLEESLRVPGQDVIETQKTAAKPARSGVSRVFWGIFIVAVGAIWLAQYFDVKWVKDTAIWPVGLIAFGLFLIFGGRGR